MKILEVAKIARKRFNRDKWLGYSGNGWRTGRKEWRKLVLNTRDLLTKYPELKREYDL